MKISSIFIATNNKIAKKENIKGTSYDSKQSLARDENCLLGKFSQSQPLAHSSTNTITILKTNHKLRTFDNLYPGLPKIIRIAVLCKTHHNIMYVYM